MNKIKIIISFLLLFGNFNIFCQNNDLLLEKYNNYRQRLLQEWIVVSPNVEQFGTNIPAVDKIIDTSGNVIWVSWSDGNSNFNHFLGILATEYRLLKNNGEDYKQTLTMLVYSFLALERLDLYSEFLLRKHHKLIDSTQELSSYVKYPEDINGFLLRDDISLGFWHQYHNKFKANYGYLNKTKDGTNTYLSVFQKGMIPKQGMSQDNIIYLLQSLALVKALVDDEDISFVTINYINNYIPDYLSTHNIIKNDTVSFSLWVDLLCDRLVRHCSHQYPESDIVLVPFKNKFKARLSKTRFGAMFSSNWYIMNPVTNNLVCEGNGEDMGVWINSFGLAEAGGYITGNDIYHNKGFNKLLSSFVFKTLLFKNINILGICGLPLPETIDDYMFRALATISDINTTRNSYNLLYLLSDKRERWTYEHNPLILYLLHRDKYSKIYRSGTELFEQDKQFYFDKLSLAPSRGPHTNYTVSDYNDYWSSSSRLNWPENKGNRRINPVWQFAGMDYMFLHNLYRLVFSPNSYTLSPNIQNTNNSLKILYEQVLIEDNSIDYNYQAPKILAP